MSPAQMTTAHDQERIYVLDRRSSAVSQIYDRLRALIVELYLQPGESLSKAALAKNFGISETPVREALLRLEEEGLVVIKPQSGTYVAAIDVEKAAEARFLRLSVEIEVVKNLCRGLEPGDQEELHAILDRQRLSSQAGDRDDFSHQDSAFHMALYRMAGVEGLWRNVRTMRAHLTRLRMLDIPQPGTMASIICEHQAILDALLARDVGASEAAVRRHLSGTVVPIDELKAKHPQFF
ncbi:MAG: GntR family transcriptional regulator [Rhodospirillales bacterium]